MARRFSLGSNLLSSQEQRGAVTLVEEIWPIFAEQRSQVLRLDRWYRNDLTTEELPQVPKTNNEQHVHLRDKSSTGWARLVVSTVSQALYLDGMRGKGSRENSPLWSIWQANGMDSRQIPLHRGSLAHGMAFETGQRALDPLTGDPMVKINQVSAKRMVALYEDFGDQYPAYAMRADPQTNDDGEQNWVITLWEGENLHRLSTETAGKSGGFAYIEGSKHGLTVPPVQRFAALSDMEDYVEGEIAPFIPLFGRIDQDTFDRLVVQRFGAHKVRFGTGLKKPATDSESRAAAAGLREGDLLVSEDPASKFGTLDETPLDGYIKARDSDIRDLAAVTQTPPHHLLGQMANLSAEALAAAEASLMRKVDERQHVYGEAHESMLRLAGMLGTSEQQAAARDFDQQVRWADTESRSLNQVADALGKIAQMLGVPVEMLWERIPGWTDADTEDAKELVEEQMARELLLAEAQGAVDRETGGNNTSRQPANPGAPVGAGSAV